MGAQVGAIDRCIKSLDGLAYSQYGRNLKTWCDLEDFLDGNSLGQGKWCLSFAGAGSSAVGLGITGLRPGVVQFNVGTTNVGRSGAYSAGPSQNGFCFGGGEYTIETESQLNDLSAAAEEYLFHFGFGDAVSAEPTDGAYFYYDRAGAGVNWRLKTANNGARTDVDSLIPVVAMAWLKLKVVVNRLATLASFYINGVLVGTIATNIPSAAGRETASVMGMRKTVGVTARTWRADWAWQHFDLAASR